ncbi:MAG: hypothetical protein JW940_17900 [Polyangiaceae bacterium]|nr:hypothetical protein [Polyangiaceae bacterium]
MSKNKKKSPLARLLDWLAWKHQLLFIVSAGNYNTELPHHCADDAAMLRFVFGEGIKASGTAESGRNPQRTHDWCSEL